MVTVGALFGGDAVGEGGVIDYGLRMTDDGFERGYISLRMINSEQVQALIYIGKSGLPLLEPLSCFSLDESGMSIFYSELWRDKLWVPKRDEDLIALFKGLVIAEGFYRETCGSTTITALIYREICKRLLDEDYALADFAFAHAVNSYTPLGGSRHGDTMHEHLKFLSELERRREQERLNKRIRLANKAANSAQKNEEQLQKNMDAMRYRMTVARMPVDEFIAEVTRRSEKPLAFFSEEIRFRLEQNQFTQEQKLQLLKRMPEMARRNVMELKIKLQSSI